ncbi:MAG TPA: tetratricopeptide repeat protein [Mycobacteriales bacterium]|jgi:putative thioredoxin|nr:tetratricopeptide repeat protein [Mycobacteriales bacterium]
MDPASIRLAGAVDLRPPPAAPTGARDGVIDVSEANFEADVLQRSTQVPVVIDFWAAWCGPCKALSPILEKLAAESAGAWVLAKIDVDANPRLAQAAQVQGIPAVKAVLNGQVVGEFTGALPEAEVRTWIAQLLQGVREGGFGAPGDGSADGDPNGGQPAVDPDLHEADEALVTGDLAASAAGYQRLLDRPGVSSELKAEARGGLARVALLNRAESLDPQQLQDLLRADPTNVAAVTGLADVLMLSDRAAEAFAMLLEAVRGSEGETRDQARTHLLGLFEVLGDADPLVARSRRDLASALF